MKWGNSAGLSLTSCEWNCVTLGLSVSFPCMYAMHTPYWDLHGEGVAVGLSLPHTFFSYLIIDHLCLCPPQEAEGYSKVGPRFSVFPLLCTVLGKKDMLKELLIHKKLIHEE